VFEENNMPDSQIVLGDLKRGYNYSMPLLVERLIAKTVNCWKIPMGTISSQALPVMV